MADPSEFLAAAEAACQRLHEPAGAHVGLLRSFGGQWVRLAGVDTAPGVSTESVRSGDPVRLGRDWAVAPMGDYDSSLFGVLVVRGPQPDGIAGQLLLVTAGLERDLFPYRTAEQEQRMADRQPADGELEPESGVGGAGYWQRLLDAEQLRCAPLQHCATVLLVAPVARAGEAWLGPALTAVRRSCRSVDVIARPELGLLAVLAVECPSLAAGPLAERLRSTLLDVGVAVGVGVASREPGGDVHDLVGQARAALAADLDGRDVVEL